MGAHPGAVMNELAALAAGRWAEFHGLEQCSLADADRHLGPPLEEELHGGMFGGEPTQFRRYPAASAAPMGITGWILGDVLVAVEIQDPPSIVLPEIGPPDAELTSELGVGWSQELWPSRGLVIHRRDDRIRVAFGLAPFEEADWADDPLRWWRIERIRR